MPAYKLEVFRVTASKLVADIHKLSIGNTFAVVVVAQMYLNAHHKVQLLITLIVGGAVGYIVLGCRQSAGVHVRGAVNALSGMETFGGLRKGEVDMLITHTAEQFVAADCVSQRTMRKWLQRHSQTRLIYQFRGSYYFTILDVRCITEALGERRELGVKSWAGAGCFFVRN